MTISYALQVTVTSEQKRRLKQIHWDTYKDIPEGSIWERAKPQINFDFDQVAHLFQVGMLPSAIRSIRSIGFWQPSSLPVKDLTTRSR